MAAFHRDCGYICVPPRRVKQMGGNGQLGDRSNPPRGLLVAKRRVPPRSDWLTRLRVPLVVLDEHAEFKWMNRSAQRLLHEPASGKSIRNEWYSRVQKRIRSSQTIHQVLTPTRLELGFEASFIEGDGSLRQFETYVCREMARPNPYSGYYCLLMSVPIGDEHANPLIRFFEQSLDLFCIADLQGYFRTINTNFSDRLGYTNQELLGRPFVDFIHPADVAATRQEMERLVSGETVIAFRNRYRDVKGRYHWFEWTARSSPDDGLVFASAREVTLQVETESQLRLQEFRERAILDNTSAVIYVKDSQGRYQFINREFSRIFNISQDEVVGKTDFDLFPEVMATQFRRNDQQVIESGQKMRWEEIAPHSDGPHNYLSIKFPLFDDDGETVSIAGISTDVSDRVWLQRTNEELRIAQQVQTRLFPPGNLELPGFDIHGKVLAASHLCGDYFDFIFRSDGRLACCVADVSGHGFGPALEMVETRAMLRMLLKENLALENTVTSLNRLLYDDIRESSFVTMLLAELDPQTKQFNYVGAGHDATLLKHDGTVVRLKSTGPLLGVIQESRFLPSSAIQLQSGDIILISTDGILETLSPEGELFGHDRITRALRHFRHASAKTILDELFSLAHAYSQKPLPQDDMTAILIKVI